MKRHFYFGLAVLFVLALVPHCLFSQGAFDICYYIPSGCNNCDGMKAFRVSLLDGQCSSNCPDSVKRDDVYYKFIPYNNSIGIAENPLSKTGFKLVFDEEFSSLSLLDKQPINLVLLE